jgi:hypothetical protein
VARRQCAKSPVQEVEEKVLAALKKADRPVAVAKLEARFGPLTAQALHRLRAKVSRYEDTVYLTGSGHQTFTRGRQLAAPARGLNPARVTRRGG